MMRATARKQEGKFCRRWFMWGIRDARYLKLWLLVATWALIFPRLAGAAEPTFAFSDGGTSVPIEFMRFHPLEKEGDYGENWFFFAQQDQGACFYATLTITNIGLGTFDGYLNLAFDPPEGAPTILHREYGRKALKASDKTYDVKIGNNRAWGEPPEYHLKIDEGNFKADLTFTAQMPSYRRGDGKVVIRGKKEYAYGINAPRAHATGSIVAGGKRYAIDGRGYHDHGWQTIKMTDFSNKGYFLRFWHDDLTFIFQDFYLKENYGGGKLQLGLVGQGDRVIAESDHYTFDMTRGKKDKASGYDIPEVFAINFKTDDVQVSGTLRVTRVMQSMDMLAALSWPVRQFIRAFISKPWMYRLRARYDLAVTRGGETRRIEGDAIPGVLYY